MNKEPTDTVKVSSSLSVSIKCLISSLEPGVSSSRNSDLSRIANFVHEENKIHSASNFSIYINDSHHKNLKTTFSRRYALI